MEDNNRELVHELVSAFHQFWHLPKMVMQHKSIVQKRSEIMVLFCLKRSGKLEMKLSEISRMLHVKAPTVTQLVNELEEKGQIERITRAEDRRSVWIKMTEAGEQVIKKVEQEIQDTYSGLIDYLGEQESRKFIASLNKVYTYFAEKIDRKKQD